MTLRYRDIPYLQRYFIFFKDNGLIAVFLWFGFMVWRSPLACRDVMGRN
ncbi:hypothetical protein [[Limnothrix rosea] IAM M-220]|nr:hypothetical protein [[Limnothrix rosea] IAM M-220]